MIFIEFCMIVEYVCMIECELFCFGFGMLFGVSSLYMGL